MVDPSGPRISLSEPLLVFRGDPQIVGPPPPLDVGLTVRGVWDDIDDIDDDPPSPTPIPSSGDRSSKTLVLLPTCGYASFVRSLCHGEDTRPLGVCV